MDNKLVAKHIIPGEVWLDTDGTLIQAHGGGVLFHEGLYYWYGENKNGISRNARVDVIGVSCYSSSDLHTWKNEGIVLPAVTNDLEHDLNPRMVLERPKVIYNDTTRKFVMWMHIDSADYSYARAGVAISDSPVGPFEYIGSFRPNEQMSRDMTLFKDTDGKAYHIFSSEGNSTLCITLLSDDYLSPTTQYTRNFINNYREAPALFKHEGKYYIITSGCTGWSPNEAEYAVAENIMGPWKVIGNPCFGTDAETTFHSQGTYVLPIKGKSGAYIFMADRWKREDLKDSRYIWLPLQIKNNTIEIKWLNQWDLSYFNY
ncbi:glycoside hydrolase family 43 protein [Ectobacillus funiculus]|uniref:glycoside hydrolase family 43 protein n=1 Tax=Ectobacillus funiculus TaxID=137993 RepID=UPI00397C5DE1